MRRNVHPTGASRLARAALAAIAAAPVAALAAWEWNFQTPVSPIAREQYDLHLFIFWICVVIFVGVFGVMFYSLFRHRKSVGHEAVQFHENTMVEIVWTVIPFLILLFMAWPATKTILAMKDTSAAELTVKVTGYQWKWNYDYLQDGFGFYSNLTTPLAQIENRAPKGEHYLLEVDNPMVVPVGKKVRVLITAGDVLHAWWVPAFGVKQDAIPGFVRDSWFKAEKTGIYRGQCAELCGKEHGFMPIVVEVKSKEDYAKWVGEQKAKVAARRRRPREGLGREGARGARRAGVRRQLRRLPPGERQGRPERVPGAGRLEGRHRPGRRAARAGARRQGGHRDGVVQATVERGPRVRDHLHAQRLEQQGRRRAAACPGAGGPQVTSRDDAQVSRSKR